MKKSNIFLLTPAFFLMALQGAKAGSKYEFSFSQSLKIEPGAKINIENVVCDIRLSQGSPGQVTIGGMKVVRAPSRKVAEEVAEKIEIMVKREEEGVYIGVKNGRQEREGLFGLLRRVSSWVDLDLLIPPGTSLRVKSTSGDIRAKGVRGEIIIKTTSGDLCLEGFVGPTSVHTTSGDISLKGIVGRVNIEGTSSDLELSGIKGDVDISVTSGDINGKDIEGNLTVKGTSGDMEITKLRGNLFASLHSGEVKTDLTQGGERVETTSGDVYIKAAIQEGKNYQVNTSSGDVNFKMMGNGPFDLVIDTASGDIDVRAPLIINSVSRNHLKGKVGKGGPTVRITTSSGDVQFTQ